MEHNFLLSVDSVDRLGTGLTMGHIQTPPKPKQREGGSFYVESMYQHRCPAIILKCPIFKMLPKCTMCHICH